MDDEPEEPRSPKREELSKTPSWIMLGFALGVACVLAWPKKEVLPPVLIASPAAAKPVVAEQPAPPTIKRAKFFEGVFAELSRYAVWQNETAEVAFWNAEQKAFSDCYEILRAGDKFYFRSIPHLTRPVLRTGIPPDSPLQFTGPDDSQVQPIIFRDPGPDTFRPQVIKAMRDDPLPIEEASVKKIPIDIPPTAPATRAVPRLTPGDGKGR